MTKKRVGTTDSSNKLTFQAKMNHNDDQEFSNFVYIRGEMKSGDGEENALNSYH